MKVRIEFDTTRPAIYTHVYHDDVEVHDLRGIFLAIDAGHFPVYILNYGDKSRVFPHDVEILNELLEIVLTNPSRKDHYGRK